jgi:hypothetical protein
VTKISLRSWSNSSQPSLDSPETLEYLKEKLFRVTYLNQGTRMTTEFTVARANSMAILVRTKRGGTSLIDVEDLLEMEEILPPVVVPKLIVRQFTEVPDAQVRQHLADRHGMILSEIPDDITKAAGLHVLLHGTPGLGHRHDKATPHQPPSDAEIAARTALLDAAYASALECLSCGYMRLPTEQGREMLQVCGKLDDDGQQAYHCDQCKDPDEFKYM